MADSFSFDLSGVDEVKRALGDVASLLESPSNYAEQPVTEWLSEVERDLFASEGASGASGRWPQLAPSTLRERALAGRGFRVLDRTGALRAAMTSVSSLRQVVEVSGDTITFHLPSPAEFHQSGTRNMPARRVLDFTDAQEQRLEEKLAREAADKTALAVIP